MITINKLFYMTIVLALYGMYWHILFHYSLSCISLYTQIVRVP